MNTTMQRFVASLEVKAKDTSKRTFIGALSTSHLDLGDGRKRDIVWPGAFEETLSGFKAGAMPDGSDPYVPLLDSHSPFSIFNVLGHMLDGEEVLTGKTLKYDLKGGGSLKVPEMYLEVEWQVIDGIDGDRTLDRLRPGSVRKMSMGYDTILSDDVDLAIGAARNLRKVALGEGSLVVFAMNPRAEVDIATVKTMLAGMRGATLTEVERKELRRLASHIGNLLKSAPAEAADEDEERAAGDTPPDAAPEQADPPKAEDDAPDMKLFDQLMLARIGITHPAHQTTEG